MAIEDARDLLREFRNLIADKTQAVFGDDVVGWGVSRQKQLEQKKTDFTQADLEMMDNAGCFDLYPIWRERFVAALNRQEWSELSYGDNAGLLSSKLVDTAGRVPELAKLLPQIIMDRANIVLREFSELVVRAGIDRWFAIVVNAQQVVVFNGTKPIRRIKLSFPVPNPVHTSGDEFVLYLSAKKGDEIIHEWQVAVTSENLEPVLAIVESGFDSLDRVCGKYKWIRATVSEQRRVGWSTNVFYRQFTVSEKDELWLEKWGEGWGEKAGEGENHTTWLVLDCA